MDYIFCTVLSKKRIYQALALIQSLYKEIKEDFQFYILCVDDETFEVMKKLNWKNITVIHDKEMGKEVQQLKLSRKLHEYCWTLKSLFIEKLFDKDKTIARITYLDSDLYFWNNPNKIFRNYQDCSVLLTKENKETSSSNKSVLKNADAITGKYNSGFISINRDENGLAALSWWKERCLESCEISPSKGKFGDQKYLDNLPIYFDNICEIKTKGVNIGPWNFRKYHYSVKNKKVYINSHPLIFFHFSGLRIVDKNKIKLIHNSEKDIPFIFKIYKYELQKVIDIVKKEMPDFDGFAKDSDLKLFWEI